MPFNPTHGHPATLKGLVEAIAKGYRYDPTDVSNVQWLWRVYDNENLGGPGMLPIEKIGTITAEFTQNRSVIIGWEDDVKAWALDAFTAALDQAFGKH